MRELVLIIGGVKIYAETDEAPEALFKIIVQNIRNAYTPKEVA